MNPVYLLSLLSVIVAAAPQTQRRQSIQTLSNAEIDAFTPYTYYASAGMCEASETVNWTCGRNCDANPNFQPTASGGDGGNVQFWYVGYDPTLETVIVSYQGTDVYEIRPVVTNAYILKRKLSSSLFPGVPSNVEVHAGFKESHEDAAAEVLAAVTSTLEARNANKVVVTGWSLGAAIALLSGLHLHLNLPDADVSVIGYGMPRVGDQDWADYMDSEMPGKVTRINNKEDQIPVLPFLFMGFHHVSGELHIKSDDSWVSCPGQDNSDDQCSVGEVDNIFFGDIDDHSGPYNGITLGCKS